MTDKPLPRDAQRCPPWRPEMGPEPRVTTWPRPYPRMRIRLDGTWRRATVTARYDWADGKVSYQLDVLRPDEEDPARLTYLIDTYWWDPRAMQPLPPDGDARTESSAGRARAIHRPSTT